MQSIAVIGAAGHTGTFVLAELERRGIAAIPIGRDRADLSDPSSIDLALEGAGAVINLAGPFLDTADAVVSAALRAGIHYLDVTAEQPSARATLERFDEPARARGIAVLPAAGFYGGLGDLLATAALGDWASADEITISIALDRWWPTAGTRKTGERNTAPRVVLASGALEPLQRPRTATHEFPEPFGRQEVVEVPLSETILIARHVRATEMHNFINRAPLDDLHDSTTPPPTAADDRGRSPQLFVIEASVRSGDRTRCLTATGRDIYAITAPLVVEAAQRLLRGEASLRGCFALGEAFDASQFLKSLAPELRLLQPVR